MVFRLEVDAAGSPGERIGRAWLRHPLRHVWTDRETYDSPVGGSTEDERRSAVPIERIFALAAGALGFLGVALGAFGAHALSERLEPRDLDIFETAVRYQMYHALALLALALVLDRWSGTLGTWAGWSFLVGILVFSGSLYVLVLTGQRWLGAVTPLGGVALLVGWALLIAHLLRSNP
jgi:uncharacterized membrane protein YgdD (TMEM256/DUF423 family)